MIFKGSRYTSTYLIPDSDSDKNVLMFPRTTRSSSELDKVYQFKAGDRLDLLAEEFYGDPQLGWVILYANPEYSNILEIQPGAVLNIPNPMQVMEENGL